MTGPASRFRPPSDNRAAALAGLAALAAFAAQVVFFAGCATPRRAYKPGYDFRAVSKIFVEEFKSATPYENSGSVVRNTFIGEFMRAGYSVTEDPASADAIVGGSVVTYQPDKRYLIMLSKPGEQRIVAQNLTEIPGSNIYSFGSAFGLKEDNQIVVSNAIVGVSAALRDAKTGEIVWSNDYTYEGLDIATALGGIAKYLIRTIPR